MFDLALCGLPAYSTRVSLILFKLNMMLFTDVRLEIFHVLLHVLQTKIVVLLFINHIIKGQIYVVIRAEAQNSFPELPLKEGATQCPQVRPCIWQHLKALSC